VKAYCNTRLRLILANNSPISPINNVINVQLDTDGTGVGVGVGGTTMSNGVLEVSVSPCAEAISVNPEPGLSSDTAGNEAPLFAVVLDAVLTKFAPVGYFQ
jgi:hypothetical protein